LLVVITEKYLRRIFWWNWKKTKSCNDCV